MEVLKFPSIVVDFVPVIQVVFHNLGNLRTAYWILVLHEPDGVVLCRSHGSLRKEVGYVGLIRYVPLVVHEPVVRRASSGRRSVCALHGVNEMTHTISLSGSKPDLRVQHAQNPENMQGSWKIQRQFSCTSGDKYLMDYEIAKGILEDHQATVAKYPMMQGRVDPDKRVLCNKTTLHRAEKDEAGIDLWDDSIGDTYVVSYFRNPILHFRRSFFTLSDAGWFAKSTHQRLNEFMPRGFQVFGGTPRGCRTLGYIKSPQGIFPYNMPMSFNYAGYIVMAETPAQDASRAARDLGSYVTAYLDFLLQGPAPWQADLESHQKYVSDPLADLTTGSWGTISANMSKYLRERHYCAPMASLCVPDRATGSDIADGVCLYDIVKILTAEGFNIFKRARTDKAAALRFETLLEHKVPPPHITKNWLRTALRPHVTEWIIDKLGFDKVEWNRRER